MIESNYAHKGVTPLVSTFGELVRKMWNPRSFKAHVSPHEVLQAISLASNKRFRIGVQGDPIEFLAWFLNELHKDLGGSKRVGTVITDAFQGIVKKTTTKGFGIEEEEAPGRPDDPPAERKTNREEQVSPFLFLSLEIPPNPVFTEDQDKNVINQVPLFNCLAKFDGNTETITTARQETSKYVIKKLPQYLILHLKRFYKNQWFMEKNTTIVNFPVKNLEMKPYTSQLAISGASPFLPSTKYNLLANVCHDGQYGTGTYKVHLPCKGNEQWMEMQDLLVKDTLPQLVSLSEAYIQVYELKGSQVA
eukprot:TRINITY_DN4285_c0_g1_i8.p1 TRINITY_DN4285_c0_g1~~TRINITY_DN4285_c0_g1_i8.p1  ORF type:complete len:305 (-),score=57.48 TRINITY_DN4285_c0_g1_i8:53-967(-)